MKQIKNPTPSFDSFKSDVGIRLEMMKAPQLDVAELRREWQSRKNAKFYADKDYQCIRRDSVEDMPHNLNPLFVKAIGDSLIWLAISRFDGLPISWSDKQDIKNAVVGKEYEAVELYPNENRNVPWGSEDHLWVLKTPNTFHPYGFGTFDQEENDEVS